MTINYLNDTSDSNGDRNLYVSGASIDGMPINNVNLSLLNSGPQNFNCLERDVLHLSHTVVVQTPLSSASARCR